MFAVLPFERLCVPGSLLFSGRGAVTFQFSWGNTPAICVDRSAEPGRSEETNWIPMAPENPAGWLEAVLGSVPRRTSTASEKPSPSVSVSLGLVPWVYSSIPSDKVSPSVSASRGFNPMRSSVPSMTPSPSVSSLRGSVREKYSWKVVSPSRSWS